jgi:hypothetical protein
MHISRVRVRVLVLTGWTRRCLSLLALHSGLSLDACVALGARLSLRPGVAGIASVTRITGIALLPGLPNVARLSLLPCLSSLPLFSRLSGGTGYRSCGSGGACAKHQRK